MEVVPPLKVAQAAPARARRGRHTLHKHHGDVPELSPSKKKNTGAAPVPTLSVTLAGLSPPSHREWRWDEDPEPFPVFGGSPCHQGGHGGTRKVTVAPRRSQWHQGGHGGTKRVMVALGRSWWHQGGHGGTGEIMVALRGSWWHYGAPGGGMRRSWWHQEGHAGTKGFMVALRRSQ